MTLNRTRQVQTYVTPGGYTLFSGYTETSPPFRVKWKRTQDQIQKVFSELEGLMPSSFAVIERSRTVYSPGSWTNPSPTGPDSGVKRIFGVPVAGSVPATPLPHGGRLRPESDYVLQLLEATNPFRSTFSVPTFAWEVVELISLFAFKWTPQPAEQGENFLNIKFNWIPFLSDLRSLTKIVRDIKSRILEFNSIVQRGGIRRRIKLDQFTITGPAYEDARLSSSIISYWGFQQTITKYKVWGSVRWFPRYGLINARLPSPTKLDQWVRAAETVLDLNPQVDKLDVLWEIFPLSWLTDYFADVGQYLRATKGRLLIEPRHICIMTKKTTIDVRKARRSSRQGAVMPFGVTTTEWYNRSSYPPGWGIAQVPVSSFLKRSQYMNIAALLAVLAGRKVDI